MYDEQIAKHYVAYRPPLHEIILDRALGEFDQKPLGLDIGCGTGYSARALKYYCESVIGIEPSLAMISQVETQAKFEYINVSAEDIPLEANQVDIVTLAGSLHYINRDRLVEELIKVCKIGAFIVVYDFKIDLSTIEQSLGLQQPQKASTYDHAMNLHGYSQLNEMSVVEDQLKLDVSSSDAAHLLLAENTRYETLQQKYQDPEPYDSLESDINDKTKTDLTVTANIFYSLYKLQ